MSLSPGTRLGPYEIVAPLGAGGMGEVWKARDARLNRLVAVKVLPAHLTEHPEALARFEREARAVAALSHPSILSIFDFGSEGGIAYAVMELLEGETLAEALAAGPVPTRKSLAWAREIAEGLASAHEKGIVHRDLKPTNVFITRDGHAKILDFGLAKQLPAFGGADPGAPTEVQGTEPGAVLGTVGYMSPEQVRGEAVDHRSDIFSFGCVLYELFTGDRAFARRTAAETMTATLREEPGPPDRAASEGTPSPALDRIVRRCIEKAPEARFQAASDLAFVLGALAGEVVRPAEPAASRPRRRTVLLALSFTALAVAAGGGAFHFLARPAGPVPSPTYRRLTFRRGFVSSARFAPDGQMVLYAAAWEGGPKEVFSTRAESKESRPLGVPGISDVLSVSRSADLLVLRRTEEGRTVLARLPLAGGSPRDLLENVSSASWAPDGASFAALVGTRGTQRIEFPPGRILLSTPDYLSDIRVSPDGEHVAFLSRPDTSASYSVDVVDLDGKRRSLSRGWNFVQSGGLAWSPEGDEVWFAADRDGGTRWLNAASLSGVERVLARLPDDAFVHDVFRDGRVLLTREIRRHAVMVLPPGEKRERDLSWLDFSGLGGISPDGRQVLVVEFGEGGGAVYSSYLRRTDGSPATRLCDGGSFLSPDGRWAVAMVRGERPSLTVVPTGAGASRALPLGGVTSLGWTDWSPDGRFVLFNGREGGGGFRVFRKDVDSPAAPEAVAPEGYEIPWGSRPVSPDGARFFAMAPDGRAVFVPWAGGETVPVPGHVLGEVPFQWIDGGKALLVRRERDVPVRIWRIDVATGSRAFFVELTPPEFAGVLRVTSVRFAPDLESYGYDYRSSLSDLYVVEGLR